MLDTAERLLKADGAHGRELLLLGGRGLTAAEERGLAVGWSAAMVAHVDEVGALADRVTEQLYARLGVGPGDPRQRCPRRAVVRRSARRRPPACALRLRPLSRAPCKPSPPIISMPPQILLAQLAEEYVFAELCEALTLSLAAENEARMRAMSAAKSNVAKMLDELVGRSRQLRQEEITNEIIELGGRKAKIAVS